MPIEISQVLHDFAIIMIISGFMAVISIKLKQPMVIGYILAGMAISPYTSPFNLVLNIDVLNLFAEIGIVLLLLVVGMEFPIEKLKKIGKKAFIIALSEALVTFAIGYLFSHYILSFSFYDKLICISCYFDHKFCIGYEGFRRPGGDKGRNSHINTWSLCHRGHNYNIFLSCFTISSHYNSFSMFKVGTSIVVVLGFIIGALLIGSKTVPKIIDYVGRLNKPDVLIVCILGVVFGLSYVAFEIGISIATGAFFAGVLIAESKVQVVSKVMATPIRDMFSALFFVSVGALMNITLIPALLYSQSFL